MTMMQQRTHGLQSCLLLRGPLKSGSLHASRVACHATQKPQKKPSGFGSQKAEQQKDGDSSPLPDEEDLALAEETTLNQASVIPPPRSYIGSSASELPTVSRAKVFQTCAKASGLIFLTGLLLRRVAPGMGDILGSDIAAVNSLLAGPDLLDPVHLGYMVGTAAAVTAGRQALLAVWPSFKEATDKSLTQVLTPLQWPDLLWLSALPGISEELLFRGGLMPAFSPDWRGVLQAGAIFGMLHNTGGRNWAFAAWAAVVGIAYGASYLQTGDIAVPMGAHVLANLAGASLWLVSRPAAAK